MADILGFFKKALPFLSVGLSLAGPAGMAASSILGKTLNVQNPTIDSITKALGNLTLTPEMQAQLQEAENQYKVQMQSMGYQHEDDLAKIAADDRASARTMQTQTRSWVVPTLACLITVGFFGLLVMTMYHVPPSGSEKILDVMTGSLGTAWIMVVTYFFGSSAGSDRKTELLAGAAGQNT
ncbi:MAG TPA: hypothetical protein VKT80_05090 [Chloroflexota bacterium]|nr:hypothetical protein [Chloroflexota bacterium]